ncbi:MAG: hypothetical protein AAGA10_18065 [Bacteroidota bacterium]
MCINLYIPPKPGYAYPNEMHHGLYYVTKSMAGALALLYVAERYGEYFNYASTNLFALSYALQQYVEEKEGIANYWDLIHEHVLVPIVAGHFSLLHTIEAESCSEIPLLAMGALPTLYEAGKIALLFANNGSYDGRQILHKESVQEIFGNAEWKGYSTHNDSIHYFLLMLTHSMNFFPQNSFIALIID